MGRFFSFSLSLLMFPDLLPLIIFTYFLPSTINASNSSLPSSLCLSFLCVSTSVPCLQSCHLSLLLFSPETLSLLSISLSLSLSFDLFLYPQYLYCSLSLYSHPTTSLFLPSPTISHISRFLFSVVSSLVSLNHAPLLQNNGDVSKIS